MLVLITVLAAVSFGVPEAPVAVTGDAPMAVAETSFGTLLTNGSSGGLWLHREGSTTCISSRRGSGGYAAELDGSILFRECLEDCHRVVSWSPGKGASELLRAPTAYGPFPAPEGVLICLPERVLLLDSSGRTLREWHTAPSPATACVLDGRLLYTTDDGALHSDRRPAPRLEGHVLAVRAVPETELAMVETVGQGTYFVSADGQAVMRAEGARSPVPAPGGAVWAELEGRGASLSGGRIVRAWAVSGRLDTLLRDVPAASPLVGSGGRLLYTDLLQGRIPGLEAGPLPPAAGSRTADESEAWLDLVPYMHQRWDTPDWFNGSWSCGPTSCMMAAQYYNRLPPDSLWCSYPSPGHWSLWGMYIPNLYSFLGHTYDDWGESPGGVWVQGSHGFICPTGGAWWDLMVEWMEQHGLYSAYGGTDWSTLTSEVDQGWPMVASTTSPYTNGHILLFNGWFEDHSFVSNDSYGDQNEPGWGSYYNGEDVIYDWAPYNNGHVQVTVAQLFYARDTVLAQADTLVDDYSWGFEKLGPSQYWHEVAAGYNGNAWWTYSTGAPPDTCVVRWKPQLPEPGQYEVCVFIPSQRATATGTYHLRTAEGWVEATLDQSLYSDQWASLGSYQLDTEPTLRLGDYTGTGGEYIAFDAARFLQSGSGTGEGANAPAAVAGLSAFPNPCGAPQVEVELPQRLFGGELTVYDLNGRAVGRKDVLDDERMALDVSRLPVGIYHLVVDGEGTRGSCRLVVLR